MNTKNESKNETKMKNGHHGHFSSSIHFCIIFDLIFLGKMRLKNEAKMDEKWLP